MDELIKFWRYIRFNWDAEELEDALESCPVDTDELTRSHLATLSEDEIESLFSELVDWFMDAFGVDNVETADILTSVGVDEDRIDNLII